MEHLQNMEYASEVNNHTKPSNPNLILILSSGKNILLIHSRVLRRVEERFTNEGTIYDVIICDVVPYVPAILKCRLSSRTSCQLIGLLVAA